MQEHREPCRAFDQRADRRAAKNILQQQARFDAFVSEFNQERPHEALNMKVPADLYAASSRPYQGPPEIDYPFHDRDALVTNCGRICIYRKTINIATVLAGQKLGLKEVDDGIWLVSFMLMIWDISTWSRGPCKPSTTRSARGCQPCVRPYVRGVKVARPRGKLCRGLLWIGRSLAP
ncbi:hypothetical protein GGE12_004954, partial [Rhizobium mongolense]|nr:hypothetical protein [Rhizobium mongolense]